MSMFDKQKPVLIGMVHLLPLPGSPNHTGQDVFERALRDATTLVAGGFDALMVENFGDVPFHPNEVEPHTVAMMTLIVDRIRQAHGVPVGVNVLRNDVRSALGIAKATDASFVRVNVHTGVMVADQGWLEGTAHRTMRYRQQIDASAVEVWADVLVKHASCPAPVQLEDAAKDLAYRGLADAVLVTGAATGAQTDPETVRRVREAIPDRPVVVASGVDASNIGSFAADGYVVGSALKHDGKVNNPVDERRVEQLVAAARGQ